MSVHAMDLLFCKTVLHFYEKSKGMSTRTNGILSKREHEVMELIAQGLNHKNVALRLSIRPETVRRHLGNIYAKLEVHNKIAAILKLRSG